MANIFCILFGHKWEECFETIYKYRKPRRRKSIFNRKGGSKRTQYPFGILRRVKSYYKCSRCGKKRKDLKEV